MLKQIELSKLEKTFVVDFCQGIKRKDDSEKYKRKNIEPLYYRQRILGMN